MSLPPILCEWDGDGFAPRPAFKQRCNEALTVHEIYRLEIVEERSRRSHSHYFACVHDAWLNLPEDQAERFSTEEHLRKWALIRSGYRDERSIVAASKAEAIRIAAFIRPMDDHAVVVVRDKVIIVWTAKSQSYRAMRKKAFGESKEAVLNILAQLVGTTPKDLEENARKAA